MTKFRRNQIKSCAGFLLCLIAFGIGGQEILSRGVLGSPEKPTYWADLIKILIGSFCGAGLAFLSNSIYQASQKTTKNKAAGNLALATIGGQINDFLVLRKGFRETQKEILNAVPNAPRWLQGKPLHFHFGENLTFDFESLSFLFEEGGAHTFTLLRLAEQRYFDVSKILGMYSEAMNEMQIKLAAKGVQSEADFSIAEIENAMGPQLVSKISSFFDALEHRFENDLKDYEQAFVDLQKVLMDTFGRKGVVNIKLPPETQSTIA